MTRYKLTKAERLNGISTVKELFNQGSFFVLYPFKIIYILKPAEAVHSNNRILIAVPRKKFKKAHLRNKIRRKIREVYRKNKDLLNTARKDFRVDFIILFLANEEPSYTLLEDKLNLALLRLRNELESPTS